MTIPDDPIDTTYLIDRGTGIPCFFLHGSLSTAALWSDVIERLQHHYRCLAPDLPDCGQSLSSVQMDWRSPALAAFVDNLLQMLGIAQPVHLVVHGTGSLYGLSWAMRFPHRVKSLTILNAGFPAARQWHAFAKIGRTPGLVSLVSIRAREEWVARVMRQHSILSESQIQQWCARLPARSWQAAANLYSNNSPKTFLASKMALASLMRHIPSIVIWGKRDRFTKWQLAQEFGTGNVVYLDESGHWLPLEAPEKLVSILLDFFEAWQHGTAAA